MTHPGSSETNQTIAFNARETAERARQLPGGWLNRIENQIHFADGERTNDRLIVGIKKGSPILSFGVGANGQRETYDMWQDDERFGVWHFRITSHWYALGSQFERTEHAVVDGFSDESEATRDLVEYRTHTKQPVLQETINGKARQIASKVVADIVHAIFEIQDAAAD